MVTLYVANNIEEASLSKEYLDIPEELHSYLQKNKVQYPYENLELITELNMYLTEKAFSQLEVYSLKDLSDEMVRYTWSSEYKELNTFFIDLLNICEKAINQNKSIVAIGD